MIFLFFCSCPICVDSSKNVISNILNKVYFFTLYIFIFKSIIWPKYQIIMLFSTRKVNFNVSAVKCKVMVDWAIFDLNVNKS